MWRERERAVLRDGGMWVFVWFMSLWFDGGFSSPNLSQRLMINSGKGNWRNRVRKVSVSQGL